MARNDAPPHPKTGMRARVNDFNVDGALEEQHRTVATVVATRTVATGRMQVTEPAVWAGTVLHLTFVRRARGWRGGRLVHSAPAHGTPGGGWGHVIRRMACRGAKGEGSENQCSETFEVVRLDSASTRSAMCIEVAAAIADVTVQVQRPTRWKVGQHC